MVRFQFPVTSHGKKAKVEVRVYPTRAAMIRSLRRHHAANGKEYDDAWYAVAAATTAPMAIRNLPNGHWRHEAVIRLVKDDCGADVVTHEAAHAGLYFYQEQVRKTVRDMEHEEVLCHLISEITGKTVNELYDRGVYDRSGA